MFDEKYFEIYEFYADGYVVVYKKPQVITDFVPDQFMLSESDLNKLETIAENKETILLRKKT